MLGGKSPTLAESAFDTSGADTEGVAERSGGKAMAWTSGSELGEFGKAAVSRSELGGAGFSSGADSTAEATALMPALEGEESLAVAAALGFCRAEGLFCFVAGL